jgi:hypothetical protein
MTSADAASLLTAILIVNASPAVSFSKIARLTRSHLSIRSYGGKSDDTVVLDRWDQQLELPQLCRLSRGHSFGEALAALITSITNGDFKHAISKWASRKPRGVAPFFRVDVVVYGNRPFPAGRIGFQTAAFDLALTYLGEKVTLQSDPKKWADLPDANTLTDGDDLIIEATITHATISAIGHLLSDGK